MLMVTYHVIPEMSYEVKFRSTHQDIESVTALRRESMNREKKMKQHDGFNAYGRIINHKGTDFPILKTAKRGDGAIRCPVNAKAACM